MARTVGIDLGTTNSLVGYIDPQTGAPKCIPGPSGSTLCPSVVSLDPDGSVIVGEPARRRLLTQPERTIYSVKRLMGRGVADIQDELRLFPFRIDPTSKNAIRVRLGDKFLTPPEISAKASTARWSLCPHILMMRSDKPQRMPANLRDSKSCVSSTNRLRRRWPTACMKSSAATSPFTISAAARSKSPC